MAFAEHYGPWAVIAGASEGTGREFARYVAARGVHCVLLARREAPLNALADTLRAQYGVDCVTASVDLSSPDALERIVDTVGPREVGLFVSNAGADPHGSLFLDRGIDAWIDATNRNINTLIKSCHHFGAAMRERGRGGLLIVGSGACYGGGSCMAVYSASKAFQLCFAESLWAELRPHGVDVLYYALAATDTPAFRQLLHDKGMPVPTGLAEPEQVAAEGFARLAHGPVHNWGTADDKAGMAPTSADARRNRVLMIDQATKSIFGER